MSKEKWAVIDTRGCTMVAFWLNAEPIPNTPFRRSDVEDPDPRWVAGGPLRCKSCDRVLHRIDISREYIVKMQKEEPCLSEQHTLTST